jgi:FkbM family methyltransferase
MKSVLIPFVARNWPFANGSGRILDLFARDIDLGSGAVAADTSDGFRMTVLADDLIGRHILMSGKFDRSVVGVLLGKAKPGDVLLDIGANIGYVSSVFLANIPGSRAICIEPQPGISDLLASNVAQFGDRAGVLVLGLADRNGTLRFHLDPANRGASRIAAEGEIEIEVRQAGAILEGMDRVDLIKIDVEGYEEPIFRSAAGALARLRPRAILFEDQTGAAAPKGAIGSILAGLGYRIFGIDKGLWRTRLKEINSEADCRFNDYIACL